AAPLARWHGARVVETYHGREGWRRGLVRGSFLPDRLMARCVDRVIAVSEAARTFLVRGKGYPARKITVVPNGRDLSVFRPGIAREPARKELGIDRTVPPADPPALGRALRDLLRDPEGARRMGQAGRDWVLTRFSLDRQVAATAHVYRSLGGSVTRSLAA